MPKINQSPFAKMKSDALWWHYDFEYKNKRHRGWIFPVSEMSRDQASAIFKSLHASIVFEADKPRLVDPAAPDKPFLQVFTDYSDYLEKYHPSTYETYRFCEIHFKPFFEKMRIITEQDISNYQNLMLHSLTKNGTPFSMTSVNRHLDYCRAAFHRAGIQPNPFVRFDKFKEKERTRYLDSDELERLLKEVAAAPNDHLLGIVLTGIMTGLRKNEILGLNAASIDFGNSIIQVSGKGDAPRSVPLPEQLKFIFRANLKKHGSGYVFENQWTHGRFYSIDRGWRQCLKNAKIKNFHFHDLRHTYATYLLLATHNIRLVQDLLGHRSITQTEKYSHILSVQKSSAVNDMVTKLFSKKIRLILRKSR